jgi:cytochrome c
MRSVILTVGLLLATHVLAADGPRLGEALTAEQVAAHRFTVYPDGEGLPAGSGNAVAGETLYQAHCLACHGDGGENGINDRLAGGRGTIDAPLPIKTVGSYWPHATTLFSYIRRAMPYQNPGSLTDDQVYALVAYVLFLNGIVDRDADINAVSLPRVEMPNRDNFSWAVSPD